MSGSKMDEVQSTLDETQEKLAQNFETLANRGDKLDNLEDKSEIIRNQADTFKAKAAQVKWTMQKKAICSTVMLVLFVGVLTAIIVASTVGN